MLSCCAVLICLQSCATFKQKNQVPDQQKTEKELIYLRDTIFREGSTVTIVEHDTVKGKPRTITTTNTKVKVIRAMGQQKIVRDTIFLRSEGSNQSKRAVAKPAKKSRSYGKFLIIFLCAASFMTVIFFLFWRRWDNIKRIMSVVYKYIIRIPHWRNKL